MKKIIVSALVLAFSCSLMAGDLDDKILGVMEGMSKPGKTLKKLSKKKDYKNPQFKQASLEIIKKYNELKSIKHSEDLYNEMHQKMLKELETYNTSLETDDFDKIKEGWTKVSQICKDCHNEYR